MSAPKELPKVKPEHREQAGAKFYHTVCPACGRHHSIAPGPGQPGAVECVCGAKYVLDLS